MNIEPIEFMPIATSISAITFEDNNDSQMRCIVEFFTASNTSLGSKTVYIPKELYETEDTQLINNTVYAKLGIMERIL